jgi:hypothetical protein
MDLSMARILVNANASKNNLALLTNSNDTSKGELRLV